MPETNVLPILFYVFAVIALGGAMVILLTKNVLHAAFGLVFCLLGVAALYILAGADFVGVTQLIVYIGGVLVLLMFGLMLTNKLKGQAVTTRLHNRFWGYIFSFGFLIVLLGALFHIQEPSWILNASKVDQQASTLEPIGELLLTQYVLAFELAGILLLLALIGAAWLVRPNTGVVAGGLPEDLA